MLAHVARCHCVHLAATIRTLISCPSTTRLTRVSGLTQCAVGPSAKSKEAWHVVATCAVTSAEGLLGWVPSIVDPPLWSLNAPCAKYGRSHDADNFPQNGPLCHTQTLAFLLLEVVHSLSHPDTQPFYLVELRRF